MAGLPYFAFAWLVALVVVGGLVGIVAVTDDPDGNASGTTALATGLFVVALVASMTL